jgi:hypothetical protein
LIGRDQIDAFEADPDGFFAKAIEVKPLLIRPKRNALFQAAAGGRGQGGASESRDTGGSGGFQGFSSVHRPESYQITESDRRSFPRSTAF